MSGPPPLATANRAPFGVLPDGRPVEAVTLSNANGMTARVIAWGATLQALWVPDRHGDPADVVLGCDDLAGYLAQPHYFGASIGRFANRIAGAQFNLDDRHYPLAPNDPPNTLHGGVAGFDRRLWAIAAIDSGPVASVTLTYASPDGEEGFPGRLLTTVTYRLDAANCLTIEMRAETDAPTIVNLTHHSYFNLAGDAEEQSALEHLLTIPAMHYLPVDAALIPTGELRAVESSNFDFRTPAPIGLRIDASGDEQLGFGNGCDQTWVFAPDHSGELRCNAMLSDPGSGRWLELWSNQPGMQCYSGNFLDGSFVGKAGRPYRRGDGIALEPQRLPDTPNRPEFGSARLDPGETYCNRIELRFNAY